MTRTKNESPHTSNVGSTQYAVYKNGDIMQSCRDKHQAIAHLESVRKTAPRQAMAWGIGDNMHLIINADIYDIRPV